MPEIDDLKAQIRELQQEVILCKELQQMYLDRLLNLTKYAVKISKQLPQVAVDIGNIMGGEKV